MQLKSLNTALAFAFGTYGLLGGVSSVWADTLVGGYSVSEGPVVASDSSAGPIFNLASPISDIRVSSIQGIYASGSSGNLGPNTTATGNLSSGIMSVNAVQGQGSNFVRAPGIGPTPWIGSSGEGPYQWGQAYTTYTTTITNTSSVAQAYNFHFYIGSAGLQVNPWVATGSTEMTSEIAASITLNNGPQDNLGTVWSYDAQLTGSAFAPQSTNATFNLVTSSNALTYSVYHVCSNGCTPAGTLSAYVTPSSPSQQSETVLFNPYVGNISLGTFLPGQSEQLTYTLEANSPTIPSAGNNELAFYGGAIAQIGDPFSTQGTGLPSDFQVTAMPVATSPSAVPEPATYAMMAEGIALIAGMALRRRRRQTA